jgi:hypothetical protein
MSVSSRFGGTRNEIEVDLSAGHHQEYVEDCSACCRPNLLRIDVDTLTQEVMVEAHRENE